MKMVPLTKFMAETARLWRNDCLEALRTPFPLTEEQQQEFYISLQSRDSPHRYFAFEYDISDIPISGYVGMGGITNIQWENRIGEISLIIDPKCRGKGHGRKAAYMLYDYAFDTLNLHTVFGEVYWTNERSVKFWTNLFPTKILKEVYLPDRKYWEGKYFDSIYFSISKEDYQKWQMNQPISPNGSGSHCGSR